MDWIFGTDKSYRDSICEKRDEILLSFKSTREMYPDVDENMNKNASKIHNN
jgi:hypothetical protein